MARPSSPRRWRAYVEKLEAYLDSRARIFTTIAAMPSNRWRFTPTAITSERTPAPLHRAIRAEPRALLSVIFHSLDFFAFFVITVAAYWLLPRRAQNVLLLVASYLFYGWVHPWWPILLFATTLVDYWAARLIH